MNKVSLLKIKQGFIDTIDDVTKTAQAVYSTTFDGGPRKIIYEGLFLSAAAAWERLVTDLFAGYINRDGRRLRDDLRDRLRQSAKSKFGELVADHVAITLPEHLKRDQAVELLDREGRNLSYADSAKLREHARAVLPAGVVSRFDQVDKRHWATLDAVTAMRNFIAHRSRNSREAMNRELSRPDLPQHLRRGKHEVHSLGTFLDAVPMKLPPGEHRAPRLAFFLGWLIALCNEI